MKKILNYANLILCLGLIVACTKDFILKDIKNETVSIIAPADNLSTPNNNITFWWDELDGAEKYNLQIVKPNFNSISQLYVDTTITKNKFSYTFTPGTYQWRIKAINGGGSTVYTTRTLIIDTTSNLNLVSVAMIAPASNTVLANNNVIFSWNQLPATTYYELLITSSTGSVTTVSNIPTTSYSYIFPVSSGVEEKFSWKVKAYNSFSQTQNNLPRSFRIDHKSPSFPSLAYPVNVTTVKDSGAFRWNYSGIFSDIKFDSLFIGTYPDSTLTNPIIIVVPRAATNTSTFSIKPTLASPTNTLTSSNYYWWKVKSIDSVGNVSAPSAVFKFKLMN
ncbi:MAG: hypothetical protein K0R26_1984 [Bacteroidota bacterium]|jgi:hypothetical protein|nr:hypothetical protein [Bacteroidota bacterium]